MVNFNNTVNCSSFINTFLLINENNKYLIVNNGSFNSSAIKSSKCKTDAIIKYSKLCLENLGKSNHDSISDRIELLQKLDKAVEAYLDRISKWTKNRWWYPLLRCFGYPQCPKKLTNLKKAVSEALKSLQSLELKKKIPEPATKKAVSDCVEVKKTAPLPTSWNKINLITDLAKYVRSYLPFEDLSRLSSITKRDKAIVEAVLVDRSKQLCEKAAQLGCTDLEIELAKEGGVYFLQNLIERANAPIMPKDFKKKLFTLSCSYDSIQSCWYSIPAYRQLFLKQYGATDQEILDSKASETEVAFNKLLLRKWGFSEQEIVNAEETPNGLNKLIKETEEAEGFVKFCHYLYPVGLKILEKCVENALGDILTQKPQLIVRIANYDFLRMRTIRSRRGVEDLPIIGGKSLLKVAESIKSYIRSDKGQAIQELKINVFDPIRWDKKMGERIREAFDNSLPDCGPRFSQANYSLTALNLFKGLRNLEINAKTHDFILPFLSLPNLQTLTIHADIGCFKEFPVVNLPQLLHCNLSGLRIVPLSLEGNVSKLQSLIVSDYMLSLRKVRLPSSLVSLEISGSMMCNLPKSIGKLNRLKKLKIIQNPQAIPLNSVEEITHLDNLEELTLHHCKINDKTPGIQLLDKMPKLTHRDIL